MRDTRSKMAVWVLVTAAMSLLSLTSVHSDSASTFRCDADYLQNFTNWEADINTRETPQGFIESPNYPNHSPTYEGSKKAPRACSWLLRGDNIELYVEEFDVEAANTSGDYVQVKGGTVYRGVLSWGEQIAVDRGDVRVYFYINQVVASRGFRIKFIALPTFQCDARYLKDEVSWQKVIDTSDIPQGFIESPNYPRVAPSYGLVQYDRTCKWILKGSDLEIEIKYFELESDNSETFLQFNNGAMYRGQELHAGDIIPTGNGDMTIRFSIDQYGSENKGFSIKFMELSSVTTLTSPETTVPTTTTTMETTIAIVTSDITASVTTATLPASAALVAGLVSGIGAIIIIVIIAVVIICVRRRRKRVMRHSPVDGSTFVTFTTAATNQQTDSSTIKIQEKSVGETPVTTSQVNNTSGVTSMENNDIYESAGNGLVGNDIYESATTTGNVRAASGAPGMDNNDIYESADYGLVGNEIYDSATPTGNTNNASGATSMDNNDIYESVDNGLVGNEIYETPDASGHVDSAGGAPCLENNDIYKASDNSSLHDDHQYESVLDM
ncbi:PREDICTED: uncharacterized protein LOC106806807 isoform X2 [Priapulus caudatus]|uniref:Uncharacterized protein LOC106806807 isoform X2 n=1 Tax=Priapulus caudatus TaxID=37621 RepID=A0ABM1DWQ3_PRICU|nr:PREDICTED: uncharacterized protein LOC106806807 isoform X2 [Priapulus caudatus]